MKGTASSAHCAAHRGQGRRLPLACWRTSHAHMKWTAPPRLPCRKPVCRGQRPKSGMATASRQAAHLGGNHQEAGNRVNSIEAGHCACTDTPLFNLSHRFPAAILLSTSVPRAHLGDPSARSHLHKARHVCICKRLVTRRRTRHGGPECGHPLHARLELTTAEEDLCGCRRPFHASLHVFTLDSLYRAHSRTSNITTARMASLALPHSRRCTQRIICTHQVALRDAGIPQACKCKGRSPFHQLPRKSFRPKRLS